MVSEAGKTRFFSYREPVTIGQKELLQNANSRFSTHLPKNQTAEKAHRIAHYLSLPWRTSLRLLAHTMEPLPGENKNKTLLGVAIRASALAGAVLLMPLGILCLPFALPFHLYSHAKRPMISLIHNPEAKTEQSASDSLHIRTHNLGFVYEFMRVGTDLRDVKTRAKEVGNWINSDQDLPEVIVFQEAFHIDGTRKLCNNLKEKYPYVIHSIAPHALGLNNGAIIASKYPIKELSYRPFDNMLGPEKWSTRGLVKIRIEKNNKQIDVYGTHLQALLGKKRAEVRKEQMEQITGWMDEDQEKNPADVQLLVGDMNASKITAWGEENDEDNAFFDMMNQNFNDVFLNDHNDKGERTSGSSKYAAKDAPDGLEALEEPSGSWCLGPFADKGMMMNLKEWFERMQYGMPKKSIVKPPHKPHYWGTKKWSSHQYAETARFDFILRRNKPGVEGSEDRAEIRRVKVPKSAQSSPSDHLPVDGEIHLPARGSKSETT